MTATGISLSEPELIETTTSESDPSVISSSYKYTFTNGPLNVYGLEFTGMVISSTKWISRDCTTFVKLCSDINIEDEEYVIEYNGEKQYIQDVLDTSLILCTMRICM